MSARTALLILGLGSAAGLGSMIGSLMEHNRLMALTLSRLPPEEMAMGGRDQFGGRKTSLVAEEFKTILNARKRFKVCSKCSTPMWIFEKEQKKEGQQFFSVRTAFIKQAVRQALKGESA